MSVKAFNALLLAPRTGSRAAAAAALRQVPLPAGRGAALEPACTASAASTQFQCVLPFGPGETALRRLLETISAAGDASFLAVLKVMGRPGRGLLSFAVPGYSLALDIPARPGLRGLFAALERITREAGGRIYLAKDSLLSRPTLLADVPCRRSASTRSAPCWLTRRRASILRYGEAAGPGGMSATLAADLADARRILRRRPCLRPGGCGAWRRHPAGWPGHGGPGTPGRRPVDPPRRAGHAGALRCARHGVACRLRRGLRGTRRRAAECLPRLRRHARHRRRRTATPPSPPAWSRPISPAATTVLAALAPVLEAREQGVVVRPWFGRRRSWAAAQLFVWRDQRRRC